MNNGWKPHLHVNSWSCCRLLAFTLRSSLVVLPPFGLFSWSQPFTPADFLLFPLTARLFHALLSPGPPAGWTARSSDRLIRLLPREIPGLWRTAMKSQTNSLFCYLDGGGGEQRPPDVTVRLNADKPEVGKPNVSTREELAVSYFYFFVLFTSTSQKEIYCLSCFSSSRTPTAVCQAGGVFLFLLSLSSPRALCCFTQTDLASGIRGPVFVTHCNSVCGERHRHHFKTRPDSAAAPHFRQGFFPWLCVFFI